MSLSLAPGHTWKAKSVESEKMQLVLPPGNTSTEPASTPSAPAPALASSSTADIGQLFESLMKQQVLVSQSAEVASVASAEGTSSSSGVPLPVNASGPPPRAPATKSRIRFDAAPAIASILAPRAVTFCACAAGTRTPCTSASTSAAYIPVLTPMPCNGGRTTRSRADGTTNDNEREQDN